MTAPAENAINATTKHMAHPKYRPDIDGLRAIAVLGVVAFHAFPSKFRGGFVGVDVFFVISGFLISSIIIGSLKRGNFSFSEFYSRRVNRIFPALIVMLSAVWIFSWVGLFPGEFEQLGKHMVGGVSFVSNFVLLGESGYFDNSAETKVLLHLWSLGIEEQFYLIWPILLWSAWRLRLSIATTILLATAVSFLLNIIEVKADTTSAFYSPQTRFWELLFGAGLAFVASHAKTSKLIVSEKMASAISIVGLLLILLSIKYISKKYLFPGWWALIPVVSATMIIYAGPKAWANRKILSSRPMVFIGLISFPLYLWHWPLLSLARIIDGDKPSVLIRLTMVFCSFLLAWMTYKFIEVPLRTHSNKKKQTIILSMLMVVVGTIGLATMLTGGFSERSNVKWSNKVLSEFSGPFWGYQKNEICASRYDQPPGADTYRWYFCYATKNEAPNIVLVGTSFANHLLPGLMKNEKTKHNSILSVGTCSPEVKSSDLPPTGNWPCTGTRIEEQQKIINKAVSSSTGPKLVIISGLDHKTNQDFIDETSRKISAYEAMGASIVIFKPHITMTYDIKSCFGRPFLPAKNDCNFDSKIVEQYEKDFRPFVSQIAAKHPNVKFFDQNKLFCSAGKCSFILNGAPLFRDEFSHYSEYASYELSKLFVEWAKDNEPSILLQ